MLWQSYSSVYGPLGLVPLVLVWIYTSWLLVLLGAEIAHALQNLRLLEAEDRRQRDDEPINGLLAAQLLAAVAATHERAGAAFEGTPGDRVRPHPDNVERVVARLKARGLIAEVRGDLNGYVPAAPAHTIRLEDVLAAFRSSDVEIAARRTSPALSDWSPSWRRPAANASEPDHRRSRPPARRAAGRRPLPRREEGSARTPHPDLLPADGEKENGPFCPPLPRRRENPSVPLSRLRERDGVRGPLAQPLAPHFAEAVGGLVVRTRDPGDRAGRDLVDVVPGPALGPARVGRRRRRRSPGMALPPGPGRSARSSWWSWPCRTSSAPARASTAPRPRGRAGSAARAALCMTGGW